MDAQTLINNIISKLVWPVFVGAVVVMFVYTGFLFLSASGDPTKITKAKLSFVYAVVGVVVAILAYSAMGIIKSILGT